jgi:Fe2+ transport system protein FeoA
VIDLIPLGSLRSGQRALVEQVLGQADHVHRLEELGIRHGASVEMLQAGSPCIVQLAGNKLCFRGGETMSILVRVGALV